MLTFTAATCCILQPLRSSAKVHPDLHVQVALLKTLALVSSELPSVPDATLQQCMSIAERLAGAYSTLWPKQRSTIDAAFVGMLKALSAKQAILTSLCLLDMSL